MDLNDAALALFGNAPEDVIGTNISVWVEDHEYGRLISIAVASGAAADFRIKLLKRDGTTVDVLLMIVAMRDDDGESLGVHGVVHDLASEVSKPASRDIVMDRLSSEESHLAQSVAAGQTVGAVPGAGVLSASGATESRVPGSGVRGRGSGERETTASSLAGKQQAREKEDNGGQGKDGPAGAIAQGGNGR